MRKSNAFCKKVLSIKRIRAILTALSQSHRKPVQTSLRIDCPKSQNRFAFARNNTYFRLAEDYLNDLAKDYRIRRAYQLEALKREKRGMSGNSFEPDELYKGQDPLWKSEW